MYHVNGTPARVRRRGCAVAKWQVRVCAVLHKLCSSKWNYRVLQTV